MMADVLFLSNGHGEDGIAGRLIDSLVAAGFSGGQIAGWAMVGQGEAYETRGIRRIGPPNLLPSEGFGTLSAKLFLRDLRAGWVRTHLAQINFARSLHGRFALLVAVGDVVPLAAMALSGSPGLFVSCAKSAHYGGRDGHTSVERMLMRRCRAVFVRDTYTSEKLRKMAVSNLHLGNPMMDGLTSLAADRFRAPGRTGVLLLPGSRGDATQNALFLIDCLPNNSAQFLGLMPCTGSVDFAIIRRALSDRPDGGWRVAVMTNDRMELVHPVKGCAMLVRNAFADLVHAASLAVGMAGTANEQAVGCGLPLIVVPGAGNQGVAYVRMKRRWYGPAALHLSRDAKAVAAALEALHDDTAMQASMRAAGRARMGVPGASDAIAQAIRAELDRTRHA